MISPGETEAGTAGMQPLPRDNLAGLIETMTGARRRGASALSKTPIGSVDPYALKIPARKGGMLLYHATLSPLTAIEHSRCGSAWHAKMAPSPAAANKWSTASRSTIIQHSAGTLDLLQNIGCFGRPDKGLGVVVVFVDVVADGHNQFLDIAEYAASKPLLG